jgi:hypothetical protein
LAGFMSFLFLVVLGLDWLGLSFIPEAGWLFILWGTVNLGLSALIIIGGFKVSKNPVVMT